MKARRVLTVALLILVILATTAASCKGGEYCDAGQHYEWRDIGTTVVAVCVP